MLIGQSVCLELKIVKFFMWYFYSAVRPDLLQNLKLLLISFDNLVATDYFRFVLFCCEFFLQSLPRNVLKDSTESVSLHLKVRGGNNLLLSDSCHFPTQINSQVLLRNSSSFVWSSVLSSDLLNSSGINLSVILSFKAVCPPFAPFYLSRRWKSFVLLVFKIS